MFLEYKVDRSVEAIHYLRVVKLYDANEKPCKPSEIAHALNYSTMVAPGGLEVDVDTLIAELSHHPDSRYARYMGGGSVGGGASEFAPSPSTPNMGGTPVRGFAHDSPADIVAQNVSGSVLSASPMPASPSTHAMPATTSTRAIPASPSTTASAKRFTFKKSIVPKEDWVKKNLERDLARRRELEMAAETKPDVDTSTPQKENHPPTTTTHHQTPSSRLQRQLDQLKELRTPDVDRVVDDAEYEAIKEDETRKRELAEAMHKIETMVLRGCGVSAEGETSSKRSTQHQPSETQAISKIPIRVSLIWRERCWCLRIDRPLV